MILSLLLFAQMSGVQFTTAVTPRTVYVGQQLSYDAMMAVNAYVASSLQSSPEYTPPDVKGAMSYDFPFDTGMVHDVSVHGLMYHQYTFHRALFPMSLGTFTIPATTLGFTLPDEHDEYLIRSHTLRGDPQTFTVIPLPNANRPADFIGAVGQFTITAHTESPSARTGHAFILTAVVTGNGNIDFLPRPNLHIPWATVVNGTDAPKWDSTGVLVHGTKTFHWVVTPRTPGNLVVPPIRYSYFDPSKKQYVTTSTKAVPLTITVGDTTTIDDASSAAQDQALTATTPFPAIVRVLQAHMITVILLIIIIAAIITLLVVRMRRRDDSLE